MTLKQLPPSPKYVHKVLEYEGCLTQPEIAEETGLPRRTVRYALTRLQEHGLVESEPVMEDARRTTVVRGMFNCPDCYWQWVDTRVGEQPRSFDDYWSEA